MKPLTFVHLATALCVLSVAGILLPGCASKTEAPVAAGAPSAADTKMGNDYGKGVAAAHAAQQQHGQASAPASNH